MTNNDGNEQLDFASPDDELVPVVPDEVFKQIDTDSEEQGGAWNPEPGVGDSVGRTMFDMPSSKDGTVTILLPNEHVLDVPIQSLVRIASRDGRSYLGAVAEGPFAEPDGMRADSTPLVVVTVQGGLLLPKYHGRAQVELIAEQLPSGTMVPPRRRPVPNSPVFLVGTHDAARILGLGGGFQLGTADGYEDLKVDLTHDNKNLFPRHFGILGTTGGGKSTTVSGIVNNAQKTAKAVVIIDTEGEYTAINEPSENQQMLEALQRSGIPPAGVENTHVYRLVGRDSSNPQHPDQSEFSVGFSELSPYAIQEILDLSNAQTERFFKAYDIVKLAMNRFKMSSVPSEQLLFEVDEFESGWPGMTLQMVYDVVAQIASIVDKSDEDPQLETLAFNKNQGQLKSIIGSSNYPGNRNSWRALQGRLGRLRRLKIFDNPVAGRLPYETLLKPGRVNIIDLGDTDSPQINNLVIAEVLRGIQYQQDENYASAKAQSTAPTPALVFIEEAHEFLSAEKIKKMPVLYQQVSRIARRGRKRWLGIIFITQLPQHLPDEVLGLVNNWILHKIGDTGVINRLRRSIGGVSESFWNRLPSLAAGQAVVSCAGFSRPLQVTIDPTPCKLLMVE